MRLLSRLLRHSRDFLKSEDGSLTPFAMMLFLCSVVVGGVAIDSSRIQATTALMQNTADSAAITALQMRSRSGTAAAAATGAIKTASAVMPISIYGEALSTADVQFGT